MSTKKHRRYKLLLDEGLHLPYRYPELNKLHNISHVTQEKLAGKSDLIIFGFCQKNNRLPVVFNTRDFKPMILTTTTSVISISTNITDKQVDVRLCKVLRDLKPRQTKGHLIRITTSKIVINKIS